jgi:hypothetical protein
MLPYNGLSFQLKGLDFFFVCFCWVQKEKYVFLHTWTMNRIAQSLQWCDYWPNTQGRVSARGWDIRFTIAHIQNDIQKIPELSFQEIKRPELITHVYLVSRLRIRGFYLSPLHFFMAWFVMYKVSFTIVSFKSGWLVRGLYQSLLQLLRLRNAKW